MIEFVVAPRDIILNDIMSRAYISESNLTPCPQFKCLKWLDPMVESEEFFTIRQGSIPMRTT